MNNDEKIIELYFQSVREFNELESQPRGFGTGDLLYRSEMHTLQMIGKFGSINLTELADKLGISKSGASKFVNKLLDKQLITKTKQLNNQKEVVFSLSKRGKVACEGHELFKKESLTPIINLILEMNDGQREFIESFLSRLVLEVHKLNKISSNNQQFQ